MGLALGGGVSYLLVTDDMFRVAALVLVSVGLVVVIILALLLIVARIQRSTIEAMGQAMKPGAINYKSQANIPLQFQQQPQLSPGYGYPLPGQGWQEPVVVEGTGSEVVG